MIEYVDGTPPLGFGKNPLAIIRFTLPGRAMQAVRLADVVDEASKAGVAVASAYQESTNGTESVVRITCTVGLAARLVAALHQASADSHRDHDDLLVLILAKAIAATVSAIDAADDDSNQGS